jgi:hypothetical protein
MESTFKVASISVKPITPLCSENPNEKNIKQKMIERVFPILQDWGNRIEKENRKINRESSHETDFFIFLFSYFMVNYFYTLLKRKIDVKTIHGFGEKILFF